MSNVKPCCTLPDEDAYSDKAKYKALCFLLAVFVLTVIILLPSPGPLQNGDELIPLTSEGKIVIGCLGFAVVLWMTEAIPFAVTSLCLMVLLHAFGVAPFNELCKIGFGSNVLLFLMGAMGLSAAMTASGLANRFLLMTLSKVGRRTDYILLSFITAGTLLSMWVTDMAVAAMLVPLGVSILKESGCEPLKSNFGKCLMIGIVYGSLIGGTATPAGCGANVLAIQFARDMAGLNVSFADWMMVGVPGALFMIPCGWFLLMKFFPPEFKEIPMPLHQIKEELESLGPLNRKERCTLIVLLIMVTLWLGGVPIGKMIGFKLPEAYVALLGFTLLFIPGLRVFPNWEEAAKCISWSGLILIAGGIAAGMLLAKTGAARYVAWALLSDISSLHPILRVIAVICLVEALKVFFSSNSVTGAVVMPLIIALAMELGINPWVFAGPAGIASSMAFIMVTSSPTNVIPYSAGYFSIAEYAKVGILMTIVGILCVTTSVAIFGPLGQMSIW